MSRTDEAKDLAKDVLLDLEQGRCALAQTVRKCIRLAELIGDKATCAWLTLEDRGLATRFDDYQHMFPEEARNEGAYRFAKIRTVEASGPLAQFMTELRLANKNGDVFAAPIATIEAGVVTGLPGKNPLFTQAMKIENSRILTTVSHELHQFALNAHRNLAQQALQYVPEKSVGVIDQSNAQGKDDLQAESIGQLAWRLSDHQFVGGLLLATLLALFGWIGYTVWPPGSSPASPRQSTAPSQSQIPHDADAPLVTFADGKRAYVNFSVVTRILEKDAAKVVAYGGDRKTVTESLDPPTESAVHEILGKRTFDEAQKNRHELEAALLNELRPKYKAVGLTIDSISLKAIRLLSADEK